MEHGIWDYHHSMSDTLTRRKRRRRLVRLVVYGAVLVAIAITVALILTGRAVVPVVSEKLYPIHYRPEIAQAAGQYGLNPYLVAAVVKTESDYNPVAVSKAGAVGLMQLMPDTAQWMSQQSSWQGGVNPNPNDPQQNLDLGACYLLFLLGIFGGKTTPTLAAYNAGQGTVQAWVDAAGGLESFDLTDIEYSETRGFVQRVEHYRDLYSRIYPDAFTSTTGSR
jgi:soluble lytic murein transglycosylase